MHTHTDANTHEQTVIQCWKKHQKQVADLTEPRKHTSPFLFTATVWTHESLQPDTMQNPNTGILSFNKKTLLGLITTVQEDVCVVYLSAWQRLTEMCNSLKPNYIQHRMLNTQLIAEQ